MPPLLRPATVTDLHAIDRIERDRFGNPWPLDAYAEELERSYGHVMVLDSPEQGILGFSCAWYIAEEAHLMRIAVHAAREGQGWGRVLLEEVVVRAVQERCVDVLLEVASRNQRAITLYQRLGFDEVGRRLNYYRSPIDDAVLMRRPLRSQPLA